eukprot:6178414-Pleurochrysis_carterae.AAC.2
MQSNLRVLPEAPFPAIGRTGRFDHSAQPDRFDRSAQPDRDMSPQVPFTTQDLLGVPATGARHCWPVHEALVVPSSLRTRAPLTANAVCPCLCPTISNLRSRLACDHALASDSLLSKAVPDSSFDSSYISKMKILVAAALSVWLRHQISKDESEPRATFHFDYIHFKRAHSTRLFLNHTNLGIPCSSLPIARFVSRLSSPGDQDIPMPSAVLDEVSRATLLKSRPRPAATTGWRPTNTPGVTY